MSKSLAKFGPIEIQVFYRGNFSKRLRTVLDEWLNDLMH